MPSDLETGRTQLGAVGEIADRGAGARGQGPAAQVRPRGHLPGRTPGRGGRPGRPARLGPQRDGQGHLRRVAARLGHRLASRVTTFAPQHPGLPDPGRRRHAARGPQGRGHHPRHVDQGQHHPGVARPAVPGRLRLPQEAVRDRRRVHEPPAHQGLGPRPEGAASSPAATSRRCSWPGCCASTPRCCCSTSPPAASTSAPRPRSRP